MKHIVYYLIVISNFLCFMVMNYFIVESLPIEGVDILIVLALELLLMGNIYVSLFRDRHGLSFAKLSTLWPFITIKRIRLEEQKRIKALEKEE